MPTCNQEGGIKIQGATASLTLISVDVLGHTLDFLKLDAYEVFRHGFGVRLDICVFEDVNLQEWHGELEFYRPGARRHVVLRVNGGQDIFFDESDRIRFYDPLV